MRDGSHAEAKTKIFSHVVKAGVILISVLSAGDLTLYAGSTTYTFAGLGGEGEFIATLQPDGSFTHTPIPPPTSTTVAIDYDPVLGPIDFSITGTGSPDWVGYSTSIITGFGVMAPPPGQGPDSMTINGAAGGGGHVPPTTGDAQILAPNGTLSSSLPLTLNGFTAGGSFEFEAGFLVSNSPFTVITGTASGILLPEPATVILMLVGLCIVLPCAVIQRRSAARSRE
jgi:hypothetical protein